MEKVRVLWCSDGPDTGYGGQTGNLLLKLKEKNKNLDFLWVAVNQAEFRKVSYNGITLFLMGYKKEKQCYAFKEIYDSFNPHKIVLFHDPRFLEFFFRYYPWTISTPVIYWHLWDNDPFPEFNLPIYECCDLIVAGSGLVKNLFDKKGIKVEYIPLGVDTNIFKPLEEKSLKYFRKKFLLEKKDFTVGFVGRNLFRKRISLLLESFKLFSKGKEDAVLVVKTSSEKDFQGFPIISAKDFHPEKFIFITGLMKENKLAKLYNCFNLFCDFAHSEGFGLPALEAMACGVPVLATKTGGLQYIVKNYGWLIEPDVRDLHGNQPDIYIYRDFVSKDSVLRILNKIYRKRRFPRDIHSYIKDNFSLDLTAEKWNNILLRDIEKKKIQKRKSYIW